MVLKGRGNHIPCDPEKLFLEMDPSRIHQLTANIMGETYAPKRPNLPFLEHMSDSI